ncbi:uncharacterized protein LOC127007530 [Eriocheir sinensis]|uniref:uncharacterized protein LOC127007530 n=1 Tax=Eriocheir sinensis TaxID=95602 RepID=UPI0021C8F2D7|nr:uncharacterized protein LOC127007530 [Eriocheir sinensis]
MVVVMAACGEAGGVVVAVRLLSAVVVMVMVVVVVNGAENAAVAVVEGVVGSRAQLPCPFSTRRPGDEPKLVLWYKEDEEGHLRPLFSRDSRASQTERQQLTQPDGQLEVGRGGSTLTYRRLALQHAGLYECHVDFFSSPVHTSRVRLVVVEPVHTVDILEEGVGVVRGGILGPYPAGHTLNVSCRAYQGVPRPTLRWWADGKVLKSSRDLVEAKVENRLVVEDISRTWHLRRLTCTANNSRLYRPAVAAVTVHMILPPVSVRVLVPGPLVEARRTVMTCEAVGSSPAPRLAWTLRQISMENEKSWVEGNKTYGELTLNATRHLHLARLSCTATNLLLNASLANSTTLVVQYPPSVRASLGQPLQARSLKEGDNVYFTCSVAANPSASVIIWYHEGRQVVQNKSAGVVTSRSSLVLRGVRRRQAGRYSCEATNSLARVRSAPVTLTIKYRPTCLTTFATYFIYDKPVAANCTVTSHPPATAIYWRWDESDEMTSAAPLRTDGGVVTSLLTVRPSGSPQRNLYCWAVNEIGGQMVPCNYTIKEVSVPRWSCRVVHIDTSSLTIVCLTPPQLDAAPTTLYTAEVYFENRTLLTNVTSTSPTFNVSHLDAGTNYQLKVYVTQGPVTSQPVVVSAYTSEAPRQASRVRQPLKETSASQELRHKGGHTRGRHPGGGPLYVAVSVEEQEEDEEDKPLEGDGEEKEDKEEKEEEFRVMLEPLSRSAAVRRQEREKAAAGEGRKVAAAAKEVVAEDAEQLHVGEWVQLVPQECEETLARKLQHVTNEKGHWGQQQPIGEWLQHQPGGWVLASSRRDPRLPVPQEESPDLWIRPPPQESYSKEVGSSPFEADRDNVSWKNRAPQRAKRWSLEASRDGRQLAESYEDWRMKFSPCLKQNTLPRDASLLPLHRHDYNVPAMRQSPPRLRDCNYNPTPGPPLHQLVRPPDDAYNNNSHGSTDSNTQQNNAMFDSNRNNNRNSMFFPSTTTKDDCPNKRWSLPHPLRAEDRHPGRRQSHQQEGALQEELLQRSQQAKPLRSRQLMRTEEHLSDMSTEHELGQVQTSRESPGTLRRLMFSEETIL